MRILLVEDEIYLGTATQKHLKNANFTVDLVYDGLEALDKILYDNYDIILLDIMLPNMSGLDILRTVRAKNINTPIILTTAKNEIEDRIAGLDHGADDYITKPYDNNELIARIKANYRRRDNEVVLNTQVFGDLLLLRDNLTLKVKSDIVTLTLKEFNLLEYLIETNNMTISKDQIIDKIWGYDNDVLPNHVEVYVSYLRKKLKLLNSTCQIKTIRGVGYQLVNNV